MLAPRIDRPHTGLGLESGPSVFEILVSGRPPAGLRAPGPLPPQKTKTNLATVGYTRYARRRRNFEGRRLKMSIFPEN